MKSFLVTWIVLLVGVFSFASPTPQSTAPQAIELSSFIKEGSLNGGIARSDDVGPLSLLKIQKQDSKPGAESFVFTIGDKAGYPLGSPGFYHVALDENGTRLVIDLSQVQQTAIDQADLQALSKNSDLIRSAEIIMDPVDQSTNLTFKMKRRVLARATASRDGSGRFSIEIKGAK